MKGSQLYNKYKKVHFGTLINFGDDINVVCTWLKDNLFYKEIYHKDDNEDENEDENQDDQHSRFLPICCDYMDGTCKPATLSDVCRKLQVMEGQEEVHSSTKGMSHAFTLFPVFHSNDAEKGLNQDFCDTRLLLVESNLVKHPQYEGIKTKIEAIRDQVCAFAMRLNKNKKKMHAKLTVLYSRSGCPEQVLHMDDNEKTRNRDFVKSCIVALEDDTKLDFASKLYSVTRDTCTISKGSFMYFCGSQVHGGASYSSPNVRLHFYLHEDVNVLNKAIDGNIILKETCKFPGCNFCTTDLDYLKKRHYPQVHKAWWKDQCNINRGVTVNTDEEGIYHCHAVPPCEGYSCLTAPGVRKHYINHHNEWWENVCRVEKRRKTNEE